MSSAATLKARIDAGETVFAPLALDALTARIAARAGFGAVYVSGGALGYAHGVSEALLTLTELTDVVRHITAHFRAEELAVIVDGGVGFGDAVHMARTVREAEATGAAAIEIEDQVAPKRVSHHRGIEHLVAAEEMAAKIEFAAKARRSGDFLLIARTGAVRNESWDAAVRRANLYREAGADLLMLMPTTEEQWASAAREIDGPLATITSLDARSGETWRELGWSLVVDPFTAQVLAVQAVQQAYGRFMAEGSTGVERDAVFATYRTLADLAGLGPLYDIEDATTEKEPSS